MMWCAVQRMAHVAVCGLRVFHFFLVFGGSWMCASYNFINGWMRGNTHRMRWPFFFIAIAVSSDSMKQPCEDGMKPTHTICLAAWLKCQILYIFVLSLLRKISISGWLGVVFCIADLDRCCGEGLFICLCFGVAKETMLCCSIRGKSRNCLDYRARWTFFRLYISPGG